jgi:hypothetical protein
MNLQFDLHRRIHNVADRVLWSRREDDIFDYLRNQAVLSFDGYLRAKLTRIGT